MSCGHDILFGAKRITVSEQTYLERARSRFAERVVAVMMDYPAPVSPDRDAAAIRGIFEAATQYVSAVGVQQYEGRPSWIYHALEDESLPGADDLAVLIGLPPLVSGICQAVERWERQLPHSRASLLRQQLIDNGVSGEGIEPTMDVISTYLETVRAARRSELSPPSRL